MPYFLCHLCNGFTASAKGEQAKYESHQNRNDKGTSNVNCHIFYTSFSSIQIQLNNCRQKYAAF